MPYITSLTCHTNQFIDACRGHVLSFLNWANVKANVMAIFHRQSLLDRFQFAAVQLHGLRPHTVYLLADSKVRSMTYIHLKFIIG